MTAIAIIAALDRELAPLVRDWQGITFSHGGHNFRGHEHSGTVAVAGGIGRTAATIAAQAMIERYHPEMLISAGVAGAAREELQAGSMFFPRVIIDSATGTQYMSESGNGTLVTADGIADRASKQALRAEFGADAVDMEAAAIADVARRGRIKFRCVKAISDEADFEMPALGRFVDAQGQFRTASFVLWAVPRPQRWPALIRLASNTRLAAQKLCDFLRELSNPSQKPSCAATTDEVSKS